MSKAYILKGGSYLRYDVDADHADAGYPKPTTGGWSGLDGTGFESDVDSVVDTGNGKAYLLKGDQYLRIDQNTNKVDGEVTPIADGWGGLGDIGFADSIDAAINWGDGKLFLFRGDSYVRYDIASDQVDPDYPLSITEWTGLADAGFESDLDAAVVWPNGKVYFFKGQQYVSYDMESDRADDDNPRSIADGWTGLAGANFADSVNAVWVKLTAEPGPGPGPIPGPVVDGQLVPGDHVWYFNGQLSRDMNIPRQTWFPGSANETDYHGHGEEIFNFVIHANGEIRRGRPHMRNHEGTHAWLNNNPGNMTGRAGGPDYGQYRDKFNWHNFLIFPSFDAGFAAIATLLRGSGYRDLSILAAFRKYAPAGDGGNQPDTYAANVAQAAGVSVDTPVRDLNDDQMRLMQEKITEIEGSVPGVVLSADSLELPQEIRNLL